MDTQSAVLEIYPNLDPMSDFKVLDNVLVEWNNPNPRPTEAQLREAWVSVFRKTIKRGYYEEYTAERGILYPEAQGSPQAESDAALMEILSNASTTRAGETRNLFARWKRAQDAADAALALKDLEALPGWGSIQAAGEAKASIAKKPSERDAEQNRAIKDLHARLAAEKNKNATQAQQITALYEMFGTLVEAVEGRVRVV